MGSVVVLASGSGTNFQAICEKLAGSPHHVDGLLCDQPEAGALKRAKALGVPSVVVPYLSTTEAGRKVSEQRMMLALREWDPDLIVLAGFMRVLSPEFVNTFPRRIINIHPSLLPKYPGLNAIRRGFQSGDDVVGITVHFVDHGVDTGEIIRQEPLTRVKDETLEELEARIHALEHKTYPDVVLALLGRSGESDAVADPE